MFTESWVMYVIKDSHDVYFANKLCGENVSKFKNARFFIL